MAINAENKLGLVNDWVPKPDAAIDPQAAARWQGINDIVNSWILNSV